MDEIRKKLEKGLKPEQIYKDEPMSKHTSFQVGGTADYFVKVETPEEWAFILQLAEEDKIPLFILGNGTNVLVREGGIRGIVLKSEQCNYRIEKNEKFAYLTAESRYEFSKTCLDCARK